MSVWLYLATYKPYLIVVNWFRDLVVKFKLIVNQDFT